MILTTKDKLKLRIEESNMFRIGFFMELLKRIRHDEAISKESEILFKLDKHQINEFINFIYKDHENNDELINRTNQVIANLADHIREFSIYSIQSNSAYSRAEELYGKKVADEMRNDKDNPNLFPVD